MKVGLFGGSFNPPHNDHKRIVQEILARGLVDEVWIIPNKIHALGKEVLDSEIRLEMVKLMFENDSRVRICTIELHKDTPSYTWETVKELKKVFDHDYYFIGGSDLTHSFSDWKYKEYLLENLSFIFTERKGFPLKKIEGMDIVGVVGQVGELSSTGIREEISAREDFKKSVPLKIYDYIVSRRLYQ